MWSRGGNREGGKVDIEGDRREEGKEREGVMVIKKKQ